MKFEFATAARIVFGRGAASDLGAIARSLGARPMLITGRDRERFSAVVERLAPCGTFAVAGEPTVDLVRSGAALARELGADVVVAVGGGSVIDAGKAIAALAANPGDVLDYLEVIGKAQPIANAPLPFIAAPTTAGTGSEVTRNAVLGSPEHGVKASLRSPLMLPRTALVDPELTLNLAPAVTASTGLDALTQLIEPFVSARANALTDMFCREGMVRVAHALRRAFRDGSDVAARESMSYASLLGGLALANAGLGVVHGFAAPIGGMFGAPHGAICAAILPHGMEANIRALRARAPESASLARYDEVARKLTGKAAARAEDGIAWVRDLCRELNIPSLSAYGMTTAHGAEIAAKAARASSSKANPIALTNDELLAVFESAL